MKPEWVSLIEESGARIVSYIPYNTYLIYGDQAAMRAVQGLARTRKHIRWEGAYLDDDKIQPRASERQARAGTLKAGEDLFAVQLVDDPAANAATLALIDAIQLAPARLRRAAPGYVNVIVRLPADQLQAVAGQPDVVSVNAYVVPKKFDERQDQIVAGNLNAAGSYPTNAGYLAWLYSKGFTQDQFTASGFAVDVTDSGLDNGTNTPNHFGLYVLSNTALASRVVYNRLEGTPNFGSTIQGCDGHGTLNAHIIGGYNDRSTFPHLDSSGYRYGLGVCPFVRVGSSVIFDPDTWTYPDYEDLISRAYRDGARISSDSWGADTAGDYDIDAQDYDALVRDAQPAASAVPSNGNQEITIVFAAGNAGPSAQTVGSPGTAKNVITVGAAENVHSHASTNGGASATGSDGCGTTDSEANSANDIASFSSRGPCSDLRKKPEIVAPGTHVTGGVAQQLRGTTNGNDLACFEGTGVCALPGGGSVGSKFNFFPTNSAQQFWTTSSGTSHSTPAVAGGCALVRQYFINQGLNAPSPAMLKAYLMNSARYMTGTDAGDALWSNNQGLGMMNLGFAFDGTARVLRDQLTNDLFTATGQARDFAATVSETGKPFRVTLTWTDAPGATTGNAYKNDLDLTVMIGGRIYKGNVFSGAYSTNGGSADARNNAESVFLPAGQTGAVLVTVSAANINSDGVPNYGGALDQDFALAVYNAAPGASNQPPSLDAIGDQSVVTNHLLAFAVTAADRFDGDAITLWATGLPPWAAFAAVTNAGGVTNTFSGTPTETGAYVTTFFAGDKDGTNQETIAISVTEMPPAVPRSLAGWILLQSNSTVSYSIPGGTIIVPNGYVIVARNATKGDFETFWSVTLATNVTYVNAAGGMPLINGGESYTLKSNSAALVDGPTATNNNPLNSSVQRISANSNATKAASWNVVTATLATPGTGGSGDGTAGVVIDEYSDAIGTGAFYFEFVELYYDAIASGPGNSPPQLDAIGNQSVVLSNGLQFAVTATPTDGDPVTLTVSNAPPGSTFGSTNEVGTFAWTNAAPVGVYTTTFYAADAGGVDYEQILISVQVAGAGGGGTETFTYVNAPAAAYGNGSYVGDGGIEWTYEGARKPDSSYDIDGQTIGFGASTIGNRSLQSAPIPGGLGNLSVKYRKYFTSAGTRRFDIYVNSNVVGSVLNANNTNAETFVTNGIDVAGDVVIKIVGTGGKQFVIDTLSWTSYEPNPDANGNGIPDVWETAMFGNLTNTAAGDNDGDGMSNLEEYLADTHPTNGQSFIAMGGISNLPGRAVFFLSTNTRVYSVEYVADPAEGGGWVDLEAGLTGSNGVTSVTDTNPADARVYRVRAHVP